MRVQPGVEENEVPYVRPDDRTVSLNRGDTRRICIMPENEFAAAQMIGAEKQAGQRIRVDVTFESHCRPALDVKYDAVAIVVR